MTAPQWVTVTHPLGGAWQVDVTEPNTPGGMWTWHLFDGRVLVAQGRAQERGWCLEHAEQAMRAYEGAGR